VLPLDIAEDGAFKRVPDVWSHKGVAIAPTAQLGNRLDVVLEPVSIQRVPCASLHAEIERMHDSGVEQGFADCRSPTEMLVPAGFFILWLGDEGCLGSRFGWPVLRIIFEGE